MLSFIFFIYFQSFKKIPYAKFQEIADLGAAVASAVLDFDINFDIGINADSSEGCSTTPTSNSDVDPGLPRCDYLDFEKCQICETDKKDISYPYCNNCYKAKKKFFPPRPKSRKKRRADLTKSGSESVTVVSDSIASSQDSGCGGSGSQESIDETDNQFSSKPSSSNGNFNDENVCEICCERTRNGLFLHGNSCHLYGCYQCAKKTWVSIGVCPLCRKKVSKVIRFLQPDMKNPL